MNRYPDPSVLYRPLTARPFIQSAAHTELPPCPALKPYIRCFWGTTEPVRRDSGLPAPSLVIPDTCMDIIFTLDHTRQTLSGRFCAMDESAYSVLSTEDETVASTFAIRFYAWTATLFTEHPLTGSKNRAYDAADFFPTLCKALTPMLLSVPSLRERADIAGRYLLLHLDWYRMNSTLMNTVDSIIAARGARSIADLAASNAVSRKRLERLFAEHIGLSPKAFSSLVRYQLLWQELCLGRERNTLDLVEKYGYYDQAHLLNDFKRHHSMTPAQALRYARG